MLLCTHNTEETKIKKKYLEIRNFLPRKRKSDEGKNVSFEGKQSTGEVHSARGDLEQGFKGSEPRLTNDTRIVVTSQDRDTVINTVINKFFGIQTIKFSRSY